MDVKYKERKLVLVPFSIIRDVGLSPGTLEQKKSQKTEVHFRVCKAQADSGRQSSRQTEGRI